MELSMSNKTLYYFGGVLTALATLSLSGVLHTPEITGDKDTANEVETLILEKNQYDKELTPNTLVYKGKSNN
jgi:hypothetical protein